MTESIPESWQIFIDQYPQLMKLQRKLGTLGWYKNDGWTMFIGHFHAGIYAQIFKPHWYNYTLDGIHFETGLTAESLQTKTLGIDLHIGHKNLFDREKFNDITIPQMGKVIATWDNEVKFSPDNLSGRLSLTIPFTKTGFATQAANAFTQLCTLGVIIDDGIAQL